MNDNENTIYLQMELKKGSFTQNEEGDFIFDVEASNENLDLEQQRVLQEALLNSKDYFLTNGVISKDHLHQQIVGDGENKRIIFNEEYVIGEPLKVYTEGGKTRVRGKLYKLNEHAQKFIKLLQEGSTRIKASVGGIAPLVQKVKENGREVGKVVSVLWNDLALTISPVNPTVGAAYMVKSLNSLEFVKALSAGYGTDSAAFTGGRALVPEYTGKKISEADIMDGLMRAILSGEINSVEKCEEYLAGFNIDKETGSKYLQFILEKDNDIRRIIPMGKSNFWNEMKEKLEKSFGKAPETEPKKDEGASKAEPETKDTQAEDEEVIATEESGGDTGGADDAMKKAMDATPILQGFQEQIAAMQSSIDVLAKSTQDILEKLEKSEETQDLLGKSLLVTVQELDRIGNTPIPRGSAVNALQTMMTKGGKVSNLEAGFVRHKQFTSAEKDEAMDVLLKAVEAGEITAIDCGKFETQINKSMRDPNFQLDQDKIRFLQKKLAK
ncbi:hypothetical protein [Treponema pedis]|uniref:hypothetical protein n=1 Tax=Treponema pedis TaxID=409322 RepID=UPI00040AAFA0|nr:hypothetical protein [Treponema pedis]